MLAAALAQLFWQPASFRLQRTWQCFIAPAVKLQFGQSGYILAHISEATWARHFKFEGSVVVVGNGGLN